MQNDLVHGWGLDFALRKCVEVSVSCELVQFLPPVTLDLLTKCQYCFSQPAHEKIGVVDSQWIVHQVVPSLGNQVKRGSRCLSIFTMSITTSPFCIGQLTGSGREWESTMGRGTCIICKLFLLSVIQRSNLVIYEYFFL
jgi:hypothetical protein